MHKPIIKNKTWSVLIPDGEWEILTNHIKDCFSTKEDVTLYIMSYKKYPTSRFSRYVTHFSYYFKTDDVGEWIATINRKVKEYRIDIIMPIYEHGIRTLIENKELIEKPKKLAILPTLASYDTVNNKLPLASHLKKHSIAAPQIIEVKQNGRYDFDRLEYPIIGKPIEGWEGRKGYDYLKKHRS